MSGAAACTFLQGFHFIFPLCFTQVMRWMEQCSYIAASRIGRSGHLLIGSVDSLFFASPTRVGDIMYISAQVPGPSEILPANYNGNPTCKQLFFASPTRVADIMYISAQVPDLLKPLPVRLLHPEPYFKHFSRCAATGRVWKHQRARRDGRAPDICGLSFILGALRAAQVMEVFGSSSEVTISVCGETSAHP